jgi:serine/threonine-protein kinase
MAGATIGLAALLLSPLRGRVGDLLGVRPSAPQSGHVAVLPFKYVGADTRGQVLCEGLVDILNSRLTQLEQFQGTLTVVPSAEMTRSGITTPSEARRRFGATLVITGSVHESGGRLRAHASVVDALTLRQVRSVEVEEAAGELFRLEDRLLERLMDMMRLRAGEGAQRVLAAGQTTSGDAHGTYVHARGLLLRYDKPGNVEAAVALLKQAVEKDPGYALAHAALGEAYWRQYQRAREVALAGLARRSCERALALEPRLAPAFVTLAMIERGTGQPREALGHLERALGIDPLSADAHREKGRVLEETGAFDTAEQAYRKAMELRPNDWSAHNQLGGFLLTRGRYAEAGRVFLHVTELAPDNVQGWNNLGSAEYGQDRLQEARRAWETSVRIEPSGTAHSNLGALAFFEGRYAEAARAFEEAVKARDRDHRLWLNLGSALYWAPGEREKARPAFEKALELAERERAVTPRDGRLLVRIATAQAMLGRAQEARTVLAEALALAPQDARVMFAAGEIHEQLGQREQALRWIASALAAGYSPREVERSPSLARLRADPRFTRAAGPR